uniref:Chemosensory protein 2 n=1 Tax=Aulacocentrum confusum TaxID=2767324 RepID=A0A7G8Z914_9HYME|nr:chemosensory protein 2 [Aulacocentrum confusum]
MFRGTLLVLVVSLMLAAVYADDEKYSDKYDTLDIDAALADDATRNKYFNCFIGNGPCTEDAAYWKNNFPEAVVTKCAKCTDWQKTAFDKIAAWYAENDEQAWTALMEKSIAEAKARNIPGAK